MENQEIQESRIVKGFFIGLFTGAATGLMTALLFAPKSGTELRRDLAKRKEDMIDDAEEFMDSAKRRASEIIISGKTRVRTIIDNTRNKIGRLRENAGELIKNVENRAHDESAGIKAAFKAGVNSFNEDTNLTGKRERQFD